MLKLRVCSYNIHKGFSHFNRRMVVHELRERLRDLNPDIVFLQEVQGLHLGHARRHVNWPHEPQHEFLAGKQWMAAYGGNAAYGHGHHGNALLSRHTISSVENHDVTLHRLERRGLLHCQIQVPSLSQPLHCFCVHLSLTEGQRRRQLAKLAEHVKRIPRQAPIIVAGDFNDWRNRAGKWFEQTLKLTEAFTEFSGAPARSFPSHLPVLRLDRIYLRHFKVEAAEVRWGEGWKDISDHAALTAELILHL